MLSEEGEEAEQSFLKEAKVMKSLAGDHAIVKLLGVCTEEQPYLMVLELMSKGDLKSLLRKNRPKVAPPTRIQLGELLNALCPACGPCAVLVWVHHGAKPYTLLSR
jgi:serine/threonine protein kinase